MIEVSFEKLLKSISEEHPAGHDLRRDTSASSLYYQIKEARNVARDVERQQSMGIETAETKPRWDKLLSLCLTALEAHTKDLEVVSFLIEALVREQGLTGLSKGFQVAQKLVETYWETLHPLPDEEGFEIRLAALNSLNGEDYEGTLIRPVYQLPITEGRSCDPFLLWQYQQALENQKLQDKDAIEKRKSQGQAFMPELQAAVKESSPAFYQALLGSLQEAKTALHHLSASIELHCPNAFATSQIDQALDFLGDTVNYVLKEAAFELPCTEVTSKEEERESALEESEKFFQKEIVKEGFASREEALKSLQHIAHFFRKTEPQSPLPYLLEHAIKLGQLSFPELLKALVSDEGARQFGCDLLGVGSI